MTIYTTRPIIAEGANCTTVVQTLSSFNDAILMDMAYEPTCVMDLLAIDGEGQFTKGCLTTTSTAAPAVAINTSGTLCFQFELRDGQLYLVNKDDLSREVYVQICKRCLTTEAIV